jgi:GMP synthase-like glutamine amidotransferase
MRPVVVVRHQMPDGLAVAADEFRAAGLATAYVELWQGEALPTVDEVAALVFLGGDMSAASSEGFSSMADELSLIRAALRDSVPLLGLCLGAQLLAAGAGGEVFRAPRPSVGFLPAVKEEAAASDPLFAGFCATDSVLRWHEDTFTLPPLAQLLMTGEGRRNLAFRIGAAAWGVQFHLEVDRSLLEAWIDDSADRLEASWGTRASALLAAADTHLTHQQVHARQAFRAFAELVTARNGTLTA